MRRWRENPIKRRIAMARWLLLTTLLSWLWIGGQAQAQSLLERLEKRLNESGVVPAQRPAGNDEAAPAPGYLGLTADVKNGRLEVISVRAGGPADAAGIKPGDRLVSVGGVEVATLDDLGEIVDKLPAGSRIETVVERNGRSQKLGVTLAAREGDPMAEALPGPPREPLPEEMPLEEPPAALGVRALPVSPDLQRRYGLIVRRGAVIESIQRGSAAERYGLPVGAAIVAVDGGRVDGPEDLAAIVGSRRPGDTIEISYYLRDQVYRKHVRLAPVAPPPGESRPLLRRLERALDDVGGAPRDEVVAQLQAQVRAMQARIDDLEQRVRDLEAQQGRRVPERPRPGIRAEEEDAGPELDAPSKPLMP
jgi:membrane-associated protease RseP (regulator of RpoE activity)